MSAKTLPPQQRPRNVRSINRLSFSVLAVLAHCLVPWAPVLAQDPSSTQDPGIVISRTVMPRTAYRGIPVEDNPVHVRATTFPADAFGTALGASLEELGGTSGSTGLVAGALRDTLTGPAGIGLQQGVSAATSAPLGLGASSASGAGGAIQAIAPTITGAVANALATMPTARAGTGP